MDVLTDADTAVRAPRDELGEVFTRRWVVELILDLAGYVPERDLAAAVAVEPAVGEGAFLGPMIDRLVASCAVHGRPLADCQSSLAAFDVADTNVERARKLAVTRRVDAGLEVDTAGSLAEHWVHTSDFPLHDHFEPGTADFVLGNPPYVRLEDVPSHLSAAYRAACSTMRGRSDLCVGFIERGPRYALEREHKYGCRMASPGCPWGEQVR